LELKQLPEHLTYAYLGEKEKQLRVLRKHKTTLGWTIADIKGISSAKCMHQILLVDEAKPTRDA
jgi:hypothetical protein